MKKLTFIFFAAVLFAAVSCTRELVIESTGMATGYELQLRTEIDGMATKAVGDPVNDITGLEDVVKTLDVYIYGTFKGDASESVKGFHLNADDHYDPVSGKWTITPDWRKEKLVPGNSYTLYVAANSSKVKTSDDSATANATKTLEAMAITTLDDLGNAIEFDYDPSTSNGAGGHYPFWGANNDDGVNPAWLALHKKYTATADITSVDPKADRYFTHDKAFLMNGKSASFIPDNDTGEITVTPEVTLSRAASKICINVSLDSGFLSKLASEKHWSLYKGEPHWRFYNFAFNAPIFGDLTQSGTYNPQVSRFTSGADMIGYSGIDGNDLYYNTTDNSFSFSTYSYPITWTAATAGTEAPAIILILGYRDDSNTSILEANRPVYYHAYKIPVVNPDLGITSLERNKIYTINATISSEGSTLVSDAYAINAAYSILDWKTTNALSISERDNSYIDVIPDAKTETTDVTDVILRGNGEQTFRLHVLKPDTKNFKIAYFGTTGASFSNPFGQTATPDPTEYPLTGNYTDENGNVYTNCAATGARVPYYLNLKGEVCNTIGSNNIQNCFVKDGDDLLIISTALPNKGVKYMKIRVFLDGHMNDDGKYMDVNIRHYPTDAIIPIEGRWSSRQSAAVAAGKIDANKVIPAPEDIFASRLALSSKVATSYDKSVYDSWTGYKAWEWEECTSAQYAAASEKRIDEGVRIKREQYTPHASEPGFEKFTGIYNDGPFFFKNGSKNETLSGDDTHGFGFGYWAAATSEENAQLGNTNDPNYPTYYWGKNPVDNGTHDDRDYSTSSPTKHWLYSERHYVYYMGNIYYRKKYYHLDPSKSISYWPNWVKDYGNNTFKVGAAYNLSDNLSVFVARIITDVKYDGNGAITLDDGNKKKVTKGINWSTSSTSTASGYPSLNEGDWCLFFGAKSGSSNMTFDAAKDPRANGESTSPKLNRYMYVLQLSESNSEYTIGRPILREDYLSEDNVVSPAFMIASQLGSLYGNMYGTYSARWAALHCASYLEVSSDGTYYMDWRLPTRAEIQTMINYQGNSSGTATLVPGSPVSGNDRVMEPVLFAYGYYALNGTAVLTNYGGGSSEYTVRCVRDLTPEEVKALNN